MAMLYNNKTMGAASVNGINNPILPQNASIINAVINYEECIARKQGRTDGLHKLYDNANDDNLTIQEHELVFSQVNTAAGMRTWNNPAPRVLSSFNGLALSQHEMDLKKKKEYGRLAHEVSRRFAFTGVALYAIEPQSQHKSGQLAVQAAGTHTIINTGRHPITPGDRVCWALPDFEGGSKMHNPIVAGLPSTKKVATIEPYNAAFDRFAYNKMTPFNKLTQVASTYSKEAIRELENLNDGAELMSMVVDDVLNHVVVSAAASSVPDLKSAATSLKGALASAPQQVQKMIEEAGQEMYESAIAGNTAQHGATLPVIVDLAARTNAIVSDRVIGYSVGGYAKANDTVDIALRANRYA